MSPFVPVQMYVEGSTPQGVFADIRKLLRFSSHHLTGRAIGMALGFVSFPIFTRIFSVEDYGAINLVLQTVLVFTVLSKAGLQNSVQRFEPEFAKGSTKDNQNFFCTIFLGSAAIAALCAVLFAIGLTLAPARILPIGATGVVLLAALLIFARAARAMYLNMLQVEGRTVILNVLEVTIKAVTILAICLLAIWWKRTITSFFLGLAAVEIGALVLLLPSFAHRCGRDVRSCDVALLRKFVKFGLPLMWAELAWVALDSGDRFLIQFFRGPEAVGYYSAAYNVSTYAQEIIMTPLNMAFFPVCVQLWTHKGEERTKEFLSRTLTYFALMAIGIIGGTFVVSHDLIVLLASERYQQADVLLPWLVAGLTISALQVFFKTGLMLQQRPMKIARATTAAAIFNIGVNVVLIPELGVLGAAIATFLSYVLWVGLTAREAHAVLPFSIQWSLIGRYTCGAAVAVLVTSRIGTENAVARLLLRCAVFCLAYFVCVLAMDRILRRNVIRFLGMRGRSGQIAQAPVLGTESAASRGHTLPARNGGAMRLEFLTQDDPIYILPFFEEFFQHYAREFGIERVIVSRLMGKRSRAQLLKELIYLYGTIGFARLGTRLLVYRMLGTLQKKESANRFYSLRQLCGAYGVAFERVNNPNEPDTVEKIVRRRPDVLVSVACPYILKANLLSVPSRGCVNIHHAALPRYRGMMPTFWQMLNGEQEVGVTVHYMTPKVDEGAALLQETLDIEAGESLDSLIRRSKRHGAHCMARVLRQIAAGTQNPAVLDQSEGSYYSFPKIEQMREFHRRGFRGI